MSYRSGEAIEDAEEAYREHCARLIAHGAAQLVAAGDMGRDAAIGKLVEWVRVEAEADGDPTGAVATENTFPSPSQVRRHSQIAAIAADLLGAAREAADHL